MKLRSLEEVRRLAAEVEDIESLAASRGESMGRQRGYNAGAEMTRRLLDAGLRRELAGVDLTFADGEQGTVETLIARMEILR